MTMKITPTNAAQTSDAVQNPALPEKTTEIEQAGISFRQALRFPQKARQKKTENLDEPQRPATQQSQIKDNPPNNSPQSAVHSPQESEKNTLEPQRTANRQNQTKESQPQNAFVNKNPTNNADQKIKENAPQHLERSAHQNQGEETQPQNELSTDQKPQKPSTHQNRRAQSKAHNETAHIHQKGKQNIPQHQVKNSQPQNESVDNNPKDTINENDQSSAERSQDLPTPSATPTIMDSAPTADQAAAIPPASPAELTAFIEKATQKILLSRADEAQNASLRLELHDDLLPQTQLIVQKQSDGSLNLAFTTDHPQSAHLLLQAHTGLTAHMLQTQDLKVNITLNNAQGQPLLEQNADDQNPSDHQNKKSDLDWDQVATHLKKL